MIDIILITKTKKFKLIYIACLILLLKFQVIQAQPMMKLSYDEACQAVRNYSALRKNPAILAEIAGLAIQNINASWLPQALIHAQATWQSEVTRIQIPIPGISVPEIPHGQYKLSAEINQLVYSGNVSVYRKNLEILQQKANAIDVEMQMDILEQQVDVLFFQIQTLRRQKNILQWQTKTLETRLNACEQRKTNGMSTPGDCALLEATILQVAQKQIEIYNAHTSTIQQLCMLTGLNLHDSVKISFPDYTMHLNSSIFNRKDLDYLGLKHEMADVQKQLALSRKKPQANAFINAGIGRPGLNMLDPDFQPWIMTGIRFSLPLLQWGIPDRDARIAGLQKQLTINQQENLLQSLNRKNAELDSEIKKIEEIIENDQKLLLLRQQITNEAQSQYDNGILSSSDFTARMAEEAEARLSIEIHQLQLEYARLKKYKLFNNQ